MAGVIPDEENGSKLVMILGCLHKYSEISLLAINDVIIFENFKKAWFVGTVLLPDFLFEGNIDLRI